MTIWLLRFCDHVTKYSSVQRAAFIGAIVGVAAWFVPALVGGGDTITQAILSDRFVVKGLLTIFLLRLLLGPWSYAAGTPGGIFAPGRRRSDIIPSRNISMEPRAPKRGGS